MSIIMAIIIAIKIKPNNIIIYFVLLLLIYVSHFTHFRGHNGRCWAEWKRICENLRETKHRELAIAKRTQRFVLKMSLLIFIFIHIFVAAHGARWSVRRYCDLRYEFRQIVYKTIRSQSKRPNKWLFELIACFGCIWMLCRAGIGKKSFSKFFTIVAYLTELQSKITKKLTRNWNMQSRNAMIVVIVIIITVMFELCSLPQSSSTSRQLAADEDEKWSNSNKFTWHFAIAYKEHYQSTWNWNKWRT